jgi:hypothetical protein
MADGVAFDTFNAATEDFTGATRLAGYHRQEMVRAIAGAVSILGYDATTSSTTALAANGLRISGFVQNVSDTDVWIDMGGAAAVDASIRVPPNYLFNFDGWQGTVTVIHAGSGNKRIITGEFNA